MNVFVLWYLSGWIVTESTCTCVRDSSDVCARIRAYTVSWHYKLCSITPYTAHKHTRSGTQYTLHMTFVYGSIKYLCTRRTLFSFPISLSCSFSNTQHCPWVSFSFSSNKRHCHVSVYKCPHTNVGPCLGVYVCAYSCDTEWARTATNVYLYDCIWFFLCHTTSPSVTSFYVCTLVCARAFVVCVFPICNFFSLSLSLFRSIALLLDPFDCFSPSLTRSSNIIYEFYLIFRKRIMRPMNFFFVASTLFRSSAYNSWLHRSTALNSAWVFLHTIFVKEKTYLFI